MPRRIRAQFSDGQEVFRNDAPWDLKHAWKVTYEANRFQIGQGGYTGPRIICRSVGYASSRAVAVRRTWNAVKDGGPKNIKIISREVVPVEEVYA